MGKFLPACPKCESTDTDLYQDRGVSARSFPHNAVFHCRCCGHRLMGLMAVEYTNRLMAEHQAAEKALAEDRLRRIEEERRLAEDRRKQEEEERRVAEAAEKAKATTPVMPRKVLPFPGVCAWVECDQPSRPKSIYCSRNCSNKNARARHKARLENRQVG